MYVCEYSNWANRLSTLEFKLSLTQSYDITDLNTASSYKGKSNMFLKPRVHKRKWDAKSQSGVFFGSKNRAAWRILEIEKFLFLVAPLSDFGSSTGYIAV